MPATHLIPALFFVLAALTGPGLASSNRVSFTSKGVKMPDYVSIDDCFLWITPPLEGVGEAKVHGRLGTQDSAPLTTVTHKFADGSYEVNDKARTDGKVIYAFGLGKRKTSDDVRVQFNVRDLGTDYQITGVQVVNIRTGQGLACGVPRAEHLKWP